MNSYEYECALSGIVVPGEAPFSGDGLDDLPQGWTEVKMSRRVFNPKWILIQQVKQGMLHGLLGQVPEESRALQAVSIRVQLEAQFYRMEQDTPIYITEVETVYLAPRELSEDVANAYDEVRENLGLDPVEVEEEAEEEEPSEKQAQAS